MPCFARDCKSMATAPRGWTTDDDRRFAEAGRWPVLVRLPNVSAEPQIGRTVKPAVPGGNEYRFDPPQAGDHSGPTSHVKTPARPSQPPASLRSAQQPHLFDRRRNIGQRGFPRRESIVLPNTNPFSNPRPRLLDSVAPAVRFLTMVALFTAAGLWVQMLGKHGSPSSHSVEVPKTAAQPQFAPAKSAADDTVPAPTATGPIETTPESGARVGQLDRDDFAARESSSFGPIPTTHPAVAPPHFLISAGGSVPRVRVTDSMADSSASNGMSGSNNTANHAFRSESDTREAPAVARFPGFLMDNSTR
jgi:hypothetical protein